MWLNIQPHFLCFNIILSSFHLLPTDEIMQVVYKKDRKANNDRNVCYILYYRQGPENYQRYVVEGIRQRKVGASAEGEICRKEACGHRHYAGCKICSSEKLQNKIKHDGDDGGGENKEDKLLFLYAVGLYLGVTLTGRIFDP